MEQPKIGVIYMYTSPSGKKYIGQTIQESKRKSVHKTTAHQQKTYFAKAICKYGWENMNYEVLFKSKPTFKKEQLKNVLNYLEKRFIKKYNTFDSEFGYNLTSGGDANKIVSDETRKKLSDSNKNKKQVYQYSLDGNLITIHKSIEDAARSIIETDNQESKVKRIVDVCNKKYTKTFNYRWSFTPMEDYSWIIDNLIDQEYTMEALQIIFEPIFEKHGMKFTKHSVTEYFPKAEKEIRRFGIKKKTIYRFDLSAKK